MSRPAAGRRGRIYVLAFVGRGDRVPRRIGRHDLTAVPIAGLVAVGARRRTAPVVSERALREQFRVLASLHQRVSAILPVRFGAMLDPEELERIVKARRGVLSSALRRIRGRTQMTVRIFGAPGGRDVPTLSRESGTVYLESRARAQRPDMPPVGAAIGSAVASIVDAELVERGRGSVRIVMHHLIRRDRVDQYCARLEKVLERFDDAEAVVVSGPLPPSAFVPDILDVTA